MATEYPISPDAIRFEIARLQSANALMRAANKALAKGDDATLVDMGFSPEHIDELQKSGGFRSTSIGSNTRLITYLRSMGGSDAR
ncbi:MULTISPECIES: hypothetical protein [Burkholderia]|uniref:hypothetical protein n=1 Tax=Burkholderia TaxID=32008 RepID=UPI0005D86582|nr:MULTISPECIES: hypothetical protein [Burkholderia]AJW93555.1 hypothetical protein BM43_7631 [Burkholderia gladioli]